MRQIKTLKGLKGRALHTGAALAARPSSAVTCGVAAEQRAARKVQKYGDLIFAQSGTFVPAVVERYGAFCDGLVGLLRVLCGEHDRDAARCEDYTPFARSRISHAAGLLGLAVVSADAAMLDDVLAGVRQRRGGQGGRATRQAQGWAHMPSQRDIEGVGGHFWYEGEPRLEG